MSYEFAYSTETHRYYTAIEANQAFHDGELLYHDSFQCSETCAYKLLCTNFKKKLTEFNVPPYFKGLPNTVHDCLNNTTLDTPSASSSIEGDNHIEQDNSAIKLLIDLKKGFLPVNKSDHEIVNNTIPLNKSKKSNGKKIVSKPSSITTLSRLVSYYYQSEWDNDKEYIQLQNGDSVSMNELFHNIDENKKLTNENKVYFGLANVIEKDTYYILKYCTRCWFEDSLWQPSVLIGKWLLTNNLLLKNRLDRLALSEEPFLLFFFGSFKLDNKTKKYIQFDVFTQNSNFLSNIYVKQ